MLIKLRPNQTNVMAYTHPLLEGLTQISDDELESLASAAATNHDVAEELILALRPLLKNVVGRYMYYWPVTRRFRDEMISEGFLALTLMLDGLPCGRVIWKAAADKIEGRINLFLNSNQSSMSPSLRQQYYLKADGQEPVYLGRNVEVPEDSHPQEGGDEASRDALDAFCKIVPRDELDEALMDEYNWGRKLRELASELGVGVETVRRRKEQLYNQFLELTK